MPSSSTSFSKSSSSISIRRRPFLFLSNLWRRKKAMEIDDIIFDREMNQRARSEPSVISYSCTTMAAPKVSTPSISTLTLTPGRIRGDLDQDMQALRLSRQDNPFLQKVIASRESLVDTLEDTVSDDAVLMASQDFNELDSDDPFMLPEVQEHMIRSPPPTTWPRSPHYVFNFSQDNNLTISSQSSDEDVGGNYCRNQNVRELFFSSGPSAPMLMPEVTNVKNTKQEFIIKTNAIELVGGDRPPTNVSSAVSRPQLLYDTTPLSVRNFK